MADYSTALVQAERIYSIATELEQKISSLEALRVKIKGEWCGPASDEYQKQLTRLIADMRATRQGLLEASSAMNEIISSQQNKMS